MREPQRGREERLEAARWSVESRRWVRLHVDLLHLAITLEEGNPTTTTALGLALACSALQEALDLAGTDDDDMCRPSCEHYATMSSWRSGAGPEPI